MTTPLSGREPYLSGAPLTALASGDEPSLGGEHGLRLVTQHLIGLLSEPRTTHLRRAAIGDWLARAGDPRPGVGIGEDGLPDLIWCPVPAGEVHLRDSARPFIVERFYIARYPVTWAQYRLFLEAEDGHSDPRWWDGLRFRPEYERTDHPLDNQPAQEVSWHDAMAYCRWLSARLPYDVRLPYEWEWQQAATGGLSEAVYPWGAEWAPSYANTRESLLRRVTAVGMYPLAESPVGALDMSGTVLEWCANTFVTAAAVDTDNPEARVMRGGSWFLIYSYARTLARTGYDPYYRYNSVGFRLAADSLEPRPAPEPPAAPEEAAPGP